MAPEQAEQSSFRDPAGQVVVRNGEIYRRVYEAGRAHYEALMQSGLYQVLADHNLLIPHEEIADSPEAGTAYLLKPQMAPFISYPYEWSFSALKDAALVTLEAQRLALEHDLILKDASAYNVQFLAGRPVIIDTLSFEPYDGARVWKAYAQFCRHFLAPLALMAKVDVRLQNLLRDYIDGIPLDLASRLLPAHSKARPGLLLHVALHSASQRRYAHKPVTAAATMRAGAGPAMAKQSLLGLADSLTRTVQALRLPARLATEWGNYYTFTNYSTDAAHAKAQLVTQLTQAAKPQQVWDLGGNDGRFSRAALAGGAKAAICFDVDPIAVEKNYRLIRSQNETALLPLLLDLTNPSPAAGWGNHERRSIAERRQPDTMIMALALIHHLAISNNLPFLRIAEYFAQLGDYLLIEFVPKADSKVQTLLATREDIFAQYDQEHFETAFAQHYDLLEQHQLAGSGRVLYLMRARHGQ